MRQIQGVSGKSDPVSHSQRARSCLKSALSLFAVDAISKSARGQAGSRRIDTTEVSWVIKAQHVSNCRNRKICVGEVSPRLENYSVEYQVRSGIASRGARNPVEMCWRNRKRLGIIRSAPMFKMVLLDKRLKAPKYAVVGNGSFLASRASWRATSPMRTADNDLRT